VSILINTVDFGLRERKQLRKKTDVQPINILNCAFSHSRHKITLNKTYNSKKELSLHETLSLHVPDICKLCCYRS